VRFSKLTAIHIQVSYSQDWRPTIVSEPTSAIIPFYQDLRLGFGEIHSESFRICGSKKFCTAVCDSLKRCMGRNGMTPGIHLSARRGMHQHSSVWSKQS
jgi:hypothetical protein